MGVMKASILRSLSSLGRPMWSSKVAPITLDSCNNLISVSDNPKSSFKNSEICAVDLLGSVTESVRLQKEVVKSMSNSGSNDLVLIEDYLDDGSVELLDTCNFLLEKIDSGKRYADSVQAACQLIERGVGPIALTRVKQLADGKKCDADDVYKCRSKLRRLSSKEKRRRKETTVGESHILTTSLAHSLDACRRLESSLSFKRGGRSSACGSTAQMVELRDVIASAKGLRDLTAEKAAEVDRSYVDSLKKKCESLVGGLGELEMGVKKLYSQLVKVRMELLGIISYQAASA